MSKHYYIESDRFVSKIGGGMADISYRIDDHVYNRDIQNNDDYRAKSYYLFEDGQSMMLRHFDSLGVLSDVIPDFDFSIFRKTLDVNKPEHNYMYWYHKDHLGSSTQISDYRERVIHHIEYMPSGEQFSEQRDIWATPYRFNGKELDAETGLYYYGARYYTAEIGIWLCVDPLSDKYPSLSPYAYCALNPVILVDPDGREINPIFDLDGNLLGTDDKGLKGTPLFMKKDDFKQGMSHDDAKSKDMGAESLNSLEAGKKVLSTMNSLPSRPDYDGHITLSEANEHYANGNGPLFADLGKIDLDFVTSKDFNGIGDSKSINTMGKSKDGNVYGHLTLKFLGNNSVSSISDNYGFEQHDKPSNNPVTSKRMSENFNRMTRNVATFGGRVYANKSLVDRGKPFDILFYGTGKIK
jgi:RHS repeat-associated protein